jgi:hypothetical protein
MKGDVERPGTEKAHGGAVAGHMVGAGVAHGIGAASDAAMTRSIVRQLPALSEDMRRWQKAVARLERLNSGPNRVAAAAAAAQLTRSLHPFGIKLPIFAGGSGPSPAEQEKDEGVVEGEGAKKAHGGAVNKDHYFTDRAHGGRVSDSRRVAIR